jgi:CxxC motif-containing protein (DUF1111 family)
MRGGASRASWRGARPAAGLLLVLALSLIAACSNGSDLLVAESGGEGTTDASNRNAFGNSARNLSDEERRAFEVGDSFFTQNWVTAPASTEARDGLGPLLNAQSCSSCHLLDGRGDAEGQEPGLLFRLGVVQDGESVPDVAYGSQIQDRSILGIPPEATVRTVYTEETGTYPDGSEYRLRRPVHELEDLAYGEVSVETVLGPRLAPPVFGAGLLEAIPEEDLVALADPDDEDGDGVSGRPNTVLEHATGESDIGRFGWKANVPTVEEQVALAFIGDIGITSPLFPDENCTDAQLECAAASTGGSPEISQEIFDQVVFYNRTLAVPARRDLEDPEVIAGAGLFEEAGCASCHHPKHETGESDIDALAGQVIYPFTDLLIHDMGPDLDDGRPDGDATGAEWRTPPLWGIGLTETVNGHLNFLHDGRARSLEEAILWHGGEAEEARQRFTGLSGDQRAQLIAFLDSL